MDKTKLLILTTEPKGWVTEQFTTEAEKLEWDVEVINPDDMYISLGADPYVSYNGTKYMGASVCIPRVSEHNLDYKMAVIAHLSSMGVYMLNKADGLALAQDKLTSQIKLNQLGFKTPKAVMVTCDSQFDYAISALDEKFPVIIKTLTGTHGIGVIKADSKSSFVSIAQTLLKHEISFLIQEFIEHEESRRIITLGNGILAANRRGAAKGDFRTNAHQGAETEAIELSQAEVAMATAISNQFELEFCAIDYILCGDEIIVLEVNGSPGLENIQTNYPDKNLTEAVIKYCAQKLGLCQDEEKDNDDEGHPEEASSAGEEDREAIETDDTEEIVDDSEETAGPEVKLFHDVIIHRINDDKPLKAKADTGAGLCSLSGIDAFADEETKTIKFTLNDVTYTAPIDRFVRIKNSNGITRRPVVKLKMSIDDHTFEGVDFTIADRANLECPVLIGRKFLVDNGVSVQFNSDEEEIEEE